MQVSSSATDANDLLNEWSQQTGASLCMDPAETTLKLSPQEGSGWIRQIQLRPGLEMTLKHLEFLERSTFEVSNVFNWQKFEFTASLSGHVRNTINSTSEEYCITPKQSRVSFFPYCGGQVECLPHQSVVQVEINVELATLNTLITDYIDQISSDLQAVLTGERQHPFLQAQTITREINRATQQALNCPYYGLTRRLYLESRAIELIALQLPTTALQVAPNPPRRQLSADDVERIYFARDILLANLVDPPSLLELARQVGINDYKLKRGFRQVFGTTAFGYLHHHRMEQAKRLLAVEDLTVIQVAQAIGYSSSTSFSAAFKKKFGVQPKTCKRHG